MTSIREQAVAIVLEAVNGHAADAKRRYAERADALDYTVSALWDQLSEAITAIPLFDQLEAEFTVGTPNTDTGPAYIEAQLTGDACVTCCREFGGNEPRYQLVDGPRGPMYAHSYETDCNPVVNP